MTQSPTPIHEAVREHYAERIKKSASCCATESACTPESELYPVDLLTTVPSDVGATTYGWRLTRRYAASGAAKFGDVAGAAERGLVWIRRWRGAVSDVVCAHYAPRNSVANARTPATPPCAAFTSALPTINPSVSCSIWRTCAALLMPKPSTKGRPPARARTRAMKLARSGGRSERAPVTPITETK